MSVGRWSLRDEEALFLEHIIREFSRSEGSNREAEALFRAIQSAFYGSGAGRSVQVDPYLVHNLAACAWVSLEYDSDQAIPWHKSDHDHGILRVLKGFMCTLARAVQKGEVEEWEDGRLHLNAFPLPDWFAQWAEEWEW